MIIIPLSISEEWKIGEAVIKEKKYYIVIRECVLETTMMASL